MSGLISGRTAVRGRVQQLTTPDTTPALEAVAHVICAMGGHIPNRDTESTGSCSYHRRIAAVALEQAELASAPVPVLFCRECSEGKHRNCNGTAWDNATDAPAPCTCPDQSHMPERAAAAITDARASR